MDQAIVVRVLAGILAVVVLGAIVARRRKGTA